MSVHSLIFVVAGVADAHESSCYSIFHVSLDHGAGLPPKAKSASSFKLTNYGRTCVGSFTFCFFVELTRTNLNNLSLVWIMVQGAPKANSASPQTVSELAQAADVMEGKRLEDAQKEAEKVGMKQLVASPPKK